LRASGLFYGKISCTDSFSPRRSLSKTAKMVKENKNILRRIIK